MKLAAFLFALSALAQEAPEIRGIVLEYGPNTPIAGATVTLVESAFYEPGIPTKTIGSVTTDARGQYSFKPGHYGDFYIDAKMAGYSAPVNLSASIATTRVMAMNDTPKMITLTLIRPGTLKGRMVDTEGKPISELSLAAGPPERVTKAVTTDRDGYFALENTPPGPYLVRATTGKVEVLDSFTTVDAEVVDEDYDSSYWPGGAADPKSALPLNLLPASELNFGTLKLPRVPYYRVRVSVATECSLGERWNLQILTPADGPIPPAAILLGCTNEFLLRNVKPGMYTLALSSGDPLNIKKWALAPLFVGRENTSVTLTMAPPVDLTGEFKTPSGTPLPNPAEFSIVTRTVDMVTTYKIPVRPDAKGRFTIPTVVWARQKVTIESLNPGRFVKEIRYNNQPVLDGLFDLVPGGTLSITVDEGAGTITGKIPGITAPGMVAIFLTRWPRGAHPLTLEPAAPFQLLSTVQADGQFAIASIPPGEYRIAAIPMTATINIFDSVLFRKVIAQAQPITLERGSTRSVELKPIDFTN